MKIVKKEINDYLIYIRENELFEGLQGFIESFVNNNCDIPASAQVLKDGRSTSVWKVKGEKAKLPSDIIIKGFKPRGPLHMLARLFGIMRGQRVFSNLAEIKDKTNAIGAPIAYIVRSSLSTDFIIMTCAEGDNLGELCLKDDFDEKSELSIDLANAFAEVLADFHLAGLTHGDLKWSNIVVGVDKTFTFVDLDNAKAHKCFNKNTAVKDLVRFYRYGFEIDKLQFTEVFFEKYFSIIEEASVELFTTLDNIKTKVEALKPTKRQ